MSYFDQDKDTYLVVDASPHGLGAILCQAPPGNPDNTTVIAYGSRALTDVESRYSQTEREALAIVWGCEHFHLYIHGQKVRVITDHKPVQLIWNNPASKPPARIERWSLRLQPYNLEIIYRPGKDNPADYMSRHPERDLTRATHHHRLSQQAETYINFIMAAAVPKAMTLEEIQTYTSKNATLQKVLELLKSNQWYTINHLQQAANPAIDIDALKSFAAVHGELTVSDDGSVILRDNRLVIPAALQGKAIAPAHQGHQGIVKTKKLLREKVWFPRIDQQVEAAIKACATCQATEPVQQKAPLQMSPLPAGPWKELSADFCGPFPSGEYLLVVIDDYSRYPVVRTTRSTSARAVIPILDDIFSMFGIPGVLRTDNGPPFNGHEFAQFATYLGFRHRKITPLWPRANGEAERFMRTIGKVVKGAVIEQRPAKQEINKFLRNYRATPHSTTQKSPAELLFHRPMQTLLPSPRTSRPADSDVRETDIKAKAKMKDYADHGARAKSTSLKVGDLVLVPNINKGKHIPRFNPKPYQVTAIKGTMITASRSNHTVEGLCRPRSKSKIHKSESWRPRLSAKHQQRKAHPEVQPEAVPSHCYQRNNDHSIPIQPHRYSKRLSSQTLSRPSQSQTRT